MTKPIDSLNPEAVKESAGTVASPSGDFPPSFPVTDKAVVLLSGGMDSTTVLHYVCRRLKVKEVHALSILYGQKHSKEIDAARRQAQAAGVAVHRVVEALGFAELAAMGSVLTDLSRAVPDLTAMPDSERTQPSTYVPNRNMILLALAAAYAEAHEIYDVFYGAQTQDEYGYWDCTPAFVEHMNTVLALNRRKAVHIHAPFLRWRKTDELRLGLELGVDYGQTWTCYRGQQKPCTTCPACVERATAFLELGM